MGAINGEQGMIFDLGEPWQNEWKGMPEFVMEDQSAWRSLTVHFAGPDDLRRLAELRGQPLTPDTRSIWYPEADQVSWVNHRYADEP